MGKIRTRVLGLEEVEEKQKKERKEKSFQKKAREIAGKHKVHTPGLKGGERIVTSEVKEADIEKMAKAKKLIESRSAPKSAKGAVGDKEKVKKTKARTRGEKYQKAKKAIDKTKNYSLDTAVKLLKKIKYTNFDESVELHLNVNEVGLKGEAILPHSIGKSVRVKIVDEALLGQIEKGKLDFDILVSHPSFMPRLARLAKILGPKGLMPNPKAGTISPKPEAVALKFQKGALRWKTEAKFPLIHQLVGKISAGEKALVENASEFIKSVGPRHIRSAFIKTTMSPSVKIDIDK